MINSSTRNAFEKKIHFSCLKVEILTLKDCGRLKRIYFQIQANLKKMVESIEKNTLVQSAPGASATETPPEDSEEYKILAEELAILATELETKCLEVQAYKENFEKLQSDCTERTSELERINSQLQKAKVDGNSAVEKLKKAEEDLAAIKEKNAQLSDELLNKSRQVIATLTFSKEYL